MTCEPVYHVGADTDVDKTGIAIANHLVAYGSPTGDHLAMAAGIAGQIERERKAGKTVMAVFFSDDETGSARVVYDDARDGLGRVDRPVEVKPEEHPGSARKRRRTRK